MLPIGREALQPPEDRRQQDGEADGHVGGRGPAVALLGSGPRDTAERVNERAAELLEKRERRRDEERAP
ncbi:MAG: hypothetical protein BRD48_05540 [Bacteroidetes bacterium QS_9_68_14]|nr:MAG: hypothetical protein BRD48_05540 [Bacteroidetes bacterium QS_9_68_14]